jgi:tetratricopeptide (TPR) repeat protein
MTNPTRLTSVPTTNEELQVLLHQAQHYHQQGELLLAAKAYDLALLAAPSSADLLDLRGAIALAVGDYTKAESCFHKSLLIDAERATSQRQLGIALRQQGKLQRALVHLRRATEIEPSSALNHTLLGAAISASGAHEEAIEIQRHAISLDGSFVGAWNNLGIAYKAAKQPEQAENAFSRALSLAPTSSDILHNLGSTQLLLRKFSAAEKHLQAALEKRPNHPKALIDLGSVKKTKGDFQLAEEYFSLALEQEPGSPTAHWNLGLLYLLQGDLARGWAEYEWRRQLPDLMIRHTNRPAWDGSPLGEQTLLLHCEQGLGDTVQFIRYVQHVPKEHGRLVVECPARLLRLLSGSTELDNVDQWVPTGETLPSFSYQAPIMSLAYLLGLDQGQLRSDSPYLVAEDECVAKWRKQLASDSSEDGGRGSKTVGGTQATPYRIGICWQGNSSYAADAERSIPQHYFDRLADIANVEWISLQRPVPEAEPAPPAAPPQDGLSQIREFGTELDTGRDGFIDTAALIGLMDLIICSDTAIPHLAGSLGVETWLLLAHQPDWRWGLYTEDCVWYSQMKLFRQREAGNWQEVFARVSEAVKKRISENM